MASETRAAADFYATARGEVAARLLLERLATLWPASPARLSFLGVGHAAPYLGLWQQGAARCIAVTPAQGGIARWPAGAANLSCTAEEDALPFPDLCFDRILLVHGLEIAENARRMLREIWRVLKDDGRLLVVAPNRRGGMGAHGEHAVRPGRAVFPPPDSAGCWRRRCSPSSAATPRYICRRPICGCSCAARAYGKPPAGSSRRPWPGVIISEAVKDVYAAMPLKAGARRRVVLADAA